jgi:hypothetical protein
MTLIIQKPTGAKLVMAQVSQPLDADAQAYVNAVEVADRERIEDPVRFAINNFVIGCKADGIWTAIKASCILAGARTLSGALVPLVGTAPTNNNFVSGDYNRKTGLVGDGSTKYLDSNRNNNADPQNNHHMAMQISTLSSVGNIGYIGAGNTPDAGATRIGAPIASATTLVPRSRNATANTQASGSLAIGFAGISRNTASEYTARGANVNYSITQSSQTPYNGNVYVFAFNGVNQFSNARLAFYSIGESLDLALLDARVTDLINAFGAAIP